MLKARLTGQQILQVLTAFPHRASGSTEEMAASKVLEDLLEGIGFRVRLEEFVAPATYLPFLWWTTGAVIAALLLADVVPFITVILALFGAGSQVLYFDCRLSPALWLPPRVAARNLVAGTGAPASQDRLFIIMAHVDTAPVSFACRDTHVGLYRMAVIAGLTVLVIAALTAIYETSDLGRSVPLWLTGLLIVALGIRLVLASVDFWRDGYTNGANGNASGVAAAILLAQRLKESPQPGIEFRLVLTSAKEAGMVGARAYWSRHRAELKARNAAILNFDTVGAGQLALVTETGMLTSISYANLLADTAKAVALMGDPFDGVRTTAHRVGDVDTVWYARDGFDALTLAAYDDKGHLPYHRPGDTLDKLDARTLADAVDFGDVLVRAYAAMLAGEGDDPQEETHE